MNVKKERVLLLMAKYGVTIHLNIYFCQTLILCLNINVQNMYTYVYHTPTSTHKHTYSRALAHTPISRTYTRALIFAWFFS